MRGESVMKNEQLTGGFFDPSGFFVYTLWGFDSSERPLYVGRSTNVISRVGQHLQKSERRSKVRCLTLLRLGDAEEMRATEERLIRFHDPEWNLVGTRRNTKHIENQLRRGT